MRTAGHASPQFAGRLADAVADRLGRPVRADPSWRPPVQGAVGHILGLRAGTEDTPLVAKLFAADAAARADNEARALELVASIGGLIPDLWTAFRLEDGTAVLVMSRRPGDRWADLRAGLTRPERARVVEQVGALAAELHRIEGPGFGPITGAGGLRATAAAWTADLAARTVADFRAAGGDAALATGVERLAGRTLAIMTAHRGGPPSFCHQDLNGGNLLLGRSAAGPVVTGVVDFERAEWADPMHDLALTVIHLMHEDENDLAPALIAAYGGLDDAAHARLQLHVVLRMAAEWAWIMGDRPANWRSKTSMLAGWLRERV